MCGSLCVVVSGKVALFVCILLLGFDSQIMGLKRAFECDDEGETGDPKRFKNSIRDVLAMLSMQDMAAKMEPFFRVVIRDEVERAVSRVLQSSFRSLFNQPDKPEERGFILRFINRPRSTIFTSSKIETEDGNPIRIELVDAKTKTLVSSGSLSSMKIEILVLDGDFNSDDRDHWSESEFNCSIIREREGRRPLVTGSDLNVTLKAGFVQISDVVFTDNSSWQRSRKFRLAARPVSKTCPETRIQEASSSAFMVKDHRGELYKKHYPPQLFDDVWRLEKIAKDGTYQKKLTKLGIQTVGDFLRFYSIDPITLRKNLGGGISNRIWETIIDHAKTCVLDDKWYTYYGGEQQFGLVFDSVYRVIGVTFDGQIFEPLASHHKDMVEPLKRKAYRNVQDFIPTDAQAIPGLNRPSTCLQIEAFQASNPELQQLELPIVHQDQPETLLNFNTFGDGNLSEFSREPANQFQAFRSSFRFTDIFPLPSTEENDLGQWSAVTSSEEISPEAPTACWGQGSSYIFSSGNDEEVGLVSTYPSFNVHMPIRKPRAGWCKLRAAITLCSVRRNILKRMWQGFYM